MAEINVVATFLDWPVPTIAQISFKRWTGWTDPEGVGRWWSYTPIAVDVGGDETVTGRNGRSGGPVLASS